MDEGAQMLAKDTAVKIRYLSNRYYNLGLALAKQKKLSKAKKALEISLKYNKYNKDARNLLGLIEYSRGETGQAVAAWAVSAGLNPEKNIASTYIKAIQKYPEGWESIDSPVRRCNRALAAAMEGNTDIAVIELKKAVSESPRYVKAKQLLALICIKNKRFDEAIRWLESSLEDDCSNEDSFYWLKMLEDAGYGKRRLKRAGRRENGKTPGKNKIFEIFRRAAIWVFAGAAAAAAAGALFVPVLSGQMRQAMDRQILEYTRMLSEKNIQIETLKQQLSESSGTDQAALEETKSRMTVR